MAGRDFAGQPSTQPAPTASPPPGELPRQRRGVTPQMHGRYPDYDVLRRGDHWDEVTRRVVLDRVEQVPPIRFFTNGEAATLRRVLRRRHGPGPRPAHPGAAMVDAKLFAGRLDGFVFADMPDDRETWRLVARGPGRRRRATGGAADSRRPDTRYGRR